MMNRALTFKKKCMPPWIFGYPSKLALAGANMNLGLIGPRSRGLHLHDWQQTFMSMFGAGNSKPKQDSCGQEGDTGYQECKGSLRNVIESQIIPRLLQAHTSVASNARTFQNTFDPGHAEIEAFASLCVQQSRESAANLVKQLQDDGVNNEDIFLKLMAPAARCLGTWWDEDRVDFTVVTLGLLHMQQLTHELGYDYHGAPKMAGSVRRVMLAAAPGSQHILGLVMVSEFFRKDGWQVVVEIANTEKEIFQTAANEWFDLIGISVGLVEQIPALIELISHVKQSSRNPDTPVLLGGPAFIGSEVSAERLGAIGIALDASHGLMLASALIDPLKSPSV
jgi:methanogenic corrinoid protein MtbC1